MNLRKKILTDKILGNILIFIFGIILKILHIIRRKKIKRIKNVKRIAICKLLGMGSIIQSTTLLKSIRSEFPETELIYISSIKNKALLNIINIIDKVYLIDDRNVFLLLLSILKFKIYFIFNRIDHYIDLEVHSNFSTILSILSFSKNKIGYYLKEEWLRNCLYNEMIFYNTNAPLNKVYEQSAKLLGKGIVEPSLYNFDNISDKYLDNLTSNPNLQKLILNSDYIVINPNASDLRIERRWGQYNYSVLINSLLKKNAGIKIVVIGSIDEKQYVYKIFEKIKDEYKNRVINTAGKFNLVELILLIKNSKLLITNDSGPMHIGFALKKKIVALFGPCSPKQYTNYKNTYFIYKKVYCSPCVHQFTISPCKGDNICMKNLETNYVIEIVNNVLDDIDPVLFDKDQDFLYSNDDNIPYGLLK